ncbi:hypothetical protein [Actinomadura keratinilytica]|uniref:hypothetical protein n=1 Tax=Actinomadura keratinilytica TaxID=547461 RepID=UPI0031EB6FDB
MARAYSILPRAVATRTAGTPVRHTAFGRLGHVPTGLGAILPELRAERDLPRGEAALYPSGFALGLVVVGPVGPAWCGGAVRRRGAAARRGGAAPASSTG